MILIRFFRFIVGIWVFFAFNSLASTPKKEPQPQQWSLAALPALGYSSDSGLGFGLTGAVYFLDPKFQSYKSSLHAQAYFTTRNIHSHYLLWDQKEAFGLPLRLVSKLRFSASKYLNYCGQGNEASCSEDMAKNEADKQGLSSKSKTDFIDRYYQNRLLSLDGGVFAQWLVFSQNFDVSIMTNYRGKYYYHGDFSQKGPYQDSLYDKHFGTSKLDGYLSTLETGLVLDNRDTEINTTKGFFIENSVRGGSKLILSAWDYFGTNSSFSFYYSLFGNRLTMQSRSIADFTFGDVNFDTLSSLGGTHAMNDVNSFGGKYIGRGIREQYFVGKAKLIEQLELKYNLPGFNLWRQEIDSTLAFFTDIGFTAWDYDKFAKQIKIPKVGFGPGLRLTWNKNFVVRADVGFSPSEKYSPQFYIVVGNAF